MALKNIMISIKSRDRDINVIIIILKSKDTTHALTSDTPHALPNVNKFVILNIISSFSFSLFFSTKTNPNFLFICLTHLNHIYTFFLICKKQLVHPRLYFLQKIFSLLSPFIYIVCVVLSIFLKKYSKIYLQLQPFGLNLDECCSI